MPVQIRTVDGDILDDLCWRHYGRESAVTAVLEANRTLGLPLTAQTVLPAGLVLTFPDLPTPAPASTIRLWD